MIACLYALLACLIVAILLAAWALWLTLRNASPLPHTTPPARGK